MASRRQKLQIAKHQRKANQMKKPGAKSRYAKKAAYLHSHGGWGWEYAEPKPWK